MERPDCLTMAKLNLLCAYINFYCALIVMRGPCIIMFIIMWYVVSSFKNVMCIMACAFGIMKCFLALYDVHSSLCDAILS